MITFCWTTIISQTIHFAWLILLIILIAIAVELFRIIQNFRRISDRVESLSDIKGWFDFLKKLGNWGKK